MIPIDLVLTVMLEYVDIFPINERLCIIVIASKAKLPEKYEIIVIFTNEIFLLGIHNRKIVLSLSHHRCYAVCILRVFNDTKV